MQFSRSGASGACRRLSDAWAPTICTPAAAPSPSLHHAAPHQWQHQQHQQQALLAAHPGRRRRCREWQSPRASSGAVPAEDLQGSTQSADGSSSDDASLQQQLGPLIGPSRVRNWPRKSSLYLLRTDGKSCSRELVTGTGKLHFAFPSTQQHLLVWRNRPQSVMVLKKLGEELLQEFYEVIMYLGTECGLKVLVEPSVYLEHIAPHPQFTSSVYTYAPEEECRLAEFVDFVVCLGGDGVILHASHLFQHHIPPVMAFNLGSLGFLTNSNFHEYRNDLAGVIYGSQQLDSCSMSFDSLDETSNTLGVMVTLRMRLLCEIMRAGNPDKPEQVYEVLNEVVIDRGSSSFLTNIECYEKGRFITRVQADGIMLATPTGSTAYSVAAGGSMVHPNVPAILLTPICPHTLSFRPIVLPDYAELELRIPRDARCSAWVCFDGRSRQELNCGDSVRVRMSENPVPTINKTDLTGDWFDSLERCFQWNDRSQQKPLTLPVPTTTGPQPILPSSSPSASSPSPTAPSMSSSSGNGSGSVLLTSAVASVPPPPSSASSL